MGWRDLFRKRTKNPFVERQAEPLFNVADPEDPEYEQAEFNAHTSLAVFLDAVNRRDGRDCLAKLRIPDPNIEDGSSPQVVLLWVGPVRFEEESGYLEGVFYEIPRELESSYRVGDRIRFEPQHMADWMINDGGRIQGGFSLQVTRGRLPADQRADFDRYVGAREWVTPQELRHAAAEVRQSPDSTAPREPSPDPSEDRAEVPARATAPATACNPAIRFEVSDSN